VTVLVYEERVDLRRVEKSSDDSYLASMFQCEVKMCIFSYWKRLLYEVFMYSAPMCGVVCVV
jgi:hypothetical protein